LIHQRTGMAVNGTYPKLKPDEGEESWSVYTEFGEKP